MNAKEKLEKLTNSWYGFALFSGIVTFLANGIGVFSLVWAAVSVFVSFVFTFAMGRLLMGKSSLTRWVLIVLGGLSVILGVVGFVGGLYGFFTEWSFRYLLYSAYIAVAVYQHGKSLNVLTDKTVKGYFTA